jgi:beta-aspartyl-peptidase (threonine type)
MPQLIVHGGAGKTRDPQSYREGIREALARGDETLRFGSSLDAVIAAVLVLEDDPFFNCGTGSSLNLDEEVEMDAAVMTDQGHFGAVACLKSVRNPILVARKVMEETDHLLVVGAGAQRLARQWGFGDYDPSTEMRRKQLEEIKTKGTDFMPHLGNFLERPKDTVGAVARDREGRIAVATSTGGYTAKLPGRVGDSPILGAGTYASAWGGISVTGHGEEIWRRLLAFRAVEGMRQERAQVVIEKLMLELGPQTCACGMIGIDWRGSLGFACNTEDMPWGIAENGQFTFSQPR